MDKEICKDKEICRRKKKEKVKIIFISPRFIDDMNLGDFFTLNRAKKKTDKNKELYIIKVHALLEKNP